MTSYADIDMDPIDGDKYQDLYYIDPNEMLPYGLTVLVDNGGCQLVPTDWQEPMPKSMGEVAEYRWVPLELEASLVR